MKTITTLMLALGAVGFSTAETIFYSPARSIADQHISVHPWGGGTISETDEMAFEGTTSIRVSTKNLFSGGKISFDSSPDLSKEYTDKNDLLEITFKVAGSSTALSGGQKGGGPGGPPPGFGPPGGFPGGFPGGPPGGQRGGGGAGGGGGVIGGGQKGGGVVGGSGGQGISPNGKGGVGLSGGTASPATAEVKTLRLVVTTTDGLKSEAYVPANVAAGSNGWRQIGIPLQTISGFSRTNKIVKEMSLSTDKTTTVWIGEVRTLVDTTPITGEPSVHDLNLAEGDEVTLSANGYGGASLLKYEWYFDKDTTGLPDATGQAIKHKFRKPDTYTITLVISDYFGLKQPYKTTITAKVN